MKTRPPGILIGLSIIAGTCLPYVWFLLDGALSPPPALEYPATTTANEGMPGKPWYATVFWGSWSSDPSKPWFEQELPPWVYYEPWLYGVVMPWWAALGALAGVGIIVLALLRQPPEGSQGLQRRQVCLAALLFVLSAAAPVIAAVVCSVRVSR